MLDFISKSYQPYSRPTGLASYISSVCLTGYGLYPLWTTRHEMDFSTKFSLSVLYGMHMATSTFAFVNLLTQGDYAPSTVNALVGATAMFKSIGDYVYETKATQSLLDKKEALEQQFEKDNVEFNRYLIFIEDLKEIETQLFLLEQEQRYFKNISRDLTKGRKVDFAAKVQTVFTELFHKAKEQSLKKEALHDLFLSGADKKPSYELQQKIALLRQEQPHNADEQINKLGRQLQFSIKINKVRDRISKIEEQLAKQELLTIAQSEYLKDMLSNLKNSITLENVAFTILSDASLISQPDFSRLSPHHQRKKVKDYLEATLCDIQRKIDKTRELFIEKKQLFSKVSEFMPNEIHQDFTGMYETMKQLVELQNQAAVAAISEKNKEKSANFTIISSVLALVICITPNIHYIKRLSQIKHGVGVLALIVSNIDMIRKYLHSEKLNAKEARQIKILLQNTSFNQIIKTNDTELRKALLSKMRTLQKNLGEKEEEPLPPRRIAKEKAKAFITHHYYKMGRKITLKQPQKSVRENSIEIRIT